MLGMVAPSPVKRRDIQGLRAVAVVAVVANHLTGHPRGGFVGVDVFFVISGFLITGLLIRDLDESPVRYVGNFYRRRARRILPAPLLVIGLTLLAARWVLAADRFDSVLRDGGWAAIFWANWHLIDLQTGYFTADGPVSPFQHYWSLAVEEQFYILWPLALFAIVALLVRGRRTLHARRMAGAVAAAALTAGSLVFALGQSVDDPTTAYFSTFTRGWELGAGALLACVLPYLRAPRWALTAMSWLGVVLIAVSLFAVDGQDGFPAPWALLPCAGAVLVLAAATRERSAVNPLLTNRLAYGIGEISYSVYLVHFPVIVLLAAKMQQRDAYFYVAAAGLTVGLSVLLWALVERPVLDSNLLLPSKGPRHRTKIVRPALAGAAVVALSVGAYTLWPGLQSARDSKLGEITSGVPATVHPTAASFVPSGGLTPQESALAGEIRAALATKTYPTLQPSFEEALAHQDVCADTSTDVCTPNTAAEQTMYVTGDSLAERLVISANAGFSDEYDILDAGQPSCPPMQLAVSFPSPDLATGCAAQRPRVLADIERMRPDVVLLIDNYGDARRLPAGTDYVAAWRSSLTTFLTTIKPYAKHVIVVTPDPSGGSPAACLTGTDRSPIDCVYTPNRMFFDVLAVEQEVARATGVGYVNTFRWFCDATFYCPNFVGNTPMKFDAIHLTNAYATRIAPLLETRIRQLVSRP